MIDWLVFIPACFALNLTFGPSNLLAMTNGARHGVGFAQRAALGRLATFIPMIAASALGLGVLLTASAALFGVVKLIGAAYLIWIGVKILRGSSDLETKQVDVPEQTQWEAVRSEALVALSNPKAILIFAAFFPQFVTMDAYWQSYAFVGGSFIVLEGVAIFLYAAGGRFASSYAADKLAWMQRASGVTMCLFGLLLLFSPAPSRAS